jgi:predicted nucleic acid-binding protein
VSKLVIDASIAAKWELSDEPESEKAIEMLIDYSNSEIDFAAPGIWHYEVANVLNKAVSTQRLTEVEGQNAFDALQALEIEFIQFPSPAEAYRFARRYRRSVYDSLYLASAEQLGVEFWTGDRKLYNAVRDRLPFVRWIGDYSSDDRERRN